MKKLNILFTLYSLTALVIIIERLLPSPLLQPYNFIRLHQINQTVIFLLATVILSFFYLQIFTNNLQTLSKKRDFLLMLLFLMGTYLFGAGEGWHEVSSFTLNQYCDLKNLVGNLCNGLFINDYYTGNIIFFIGGLMMNVSLLTLASFYPMKEFNKKDMVILFINSVVFAFTWFVYSAFDKVLVGLFFSTVLMIISIYFAQKIKWRFRKYPFIAYSVVAYILATVSAALVRFF
ncbi:hypothetical protein HYS94_00960 [Candidatus Daviesbacteria bacterium]|nr:hypothetical protein [Candidatus Daviesbacteria bacterium]